MIIILQKNEPLTPEAFMQARTAYKDFVKITIDIKNQTVALGGEYHADAEKMLLGQGSRQENIWGGGIDLSTSIFFVNAMINLRPGSNDSTDILDPVTREQFLSQAKEALKYHVR